MDQAVSIRLTSPEPLFGLFSQIKRDFDPDTTHLQVTGRWNPGTAATGLQPVWVWLPPKRLYVYLSHQGDRFMTHNYKSSSNRNGIILGTVSIRKATKNRPIVYSFWGPLLSGIFEGSADEVREVAEQLHMTVIYSRENSRSQKKEKK